jgi:hypothetical protein
MEAAAISEKYIGKVVLVIYQDGKGVITQRTIRVKSIEGGKVRAYDIDKRQPRVFDVARILATQLVTRHAS